MAWPTTDNPRTEFVTLRMTADEAAELDWLKATLGLASRSEALRIAAGNEVMRAKRVAGAKQHRGSKGKKIGKTS